MLWTRYRVGMIFSTLGLAILAILILTTFEGGCVIGGNPTVYTNEELKSYKGQDVQMVIDEFGKPNWEGPLHGNSSLKIMYTHIKVKQEYKTHYRIVYFHLSPPYEGTRMVERVETNGR